MKNIIWSKIKLLFILILCIAISLFTFSCEKFTNAVKACIKIFIEEFIEEVHITESAQMKIKLKGSQSFVYLSPEKEIYKELVNYLDTNLFRVSVEGRNQVFVRNYERQPLFRGK